MVYQYQDRKTTSLQKKKGQSALAFFYHVIRFQLRGWVHTFSIATISKPSSANILPFVAISTACPASFAVVLLSMICPFNLSVLLPFSFTNTKYCFTADPSEHFFPAVVVPGFLASVRLIMFYGKLAFTSMTPLV